nr:MAG TPA: hypothetical protein [Herelleviridae sp.]
MRFSNRCRIKPPKSRCEEKAQFYSVCILSKRVKIGLIKPPKSRHKPPK